jgi:hypothetical protein
MPLHLIKLCVGVDGVKDLEDWIVEKRKKTKGAAGEHIHTTRMVPKRADELTGGGSLFWVIRGELCCRQRLLAVRPLPPGARAESGAGRAAAVSRIPGLALLRRRGSAARPGPRRAGRCQDAGDLAPRAARARPAVTPRTALPETPASGSLSQT